jgi:hypothetical protein
MTKFQLVTNKATKAEVFDHAIVAFAERGFVLAAYMDNPRVRTELLGQPCFHGLAGPMWGGTTAEGEVIVRYEDWPTYNFLCT